MIKKKTNSWKTILIAISVMSFSTLAFSETIAVPEDAKTIQEAIDLAQGDDIILVNPGRYIETINFKGKAITLRSAKGAAVTTIDGWMAKDSVVKCISGEGPSTRS